MEKKFEEVTDSSDVDKKDNRNIRRIIMIIAATLLLHLLLFSILWFTIIRPPKTSNQDAKQRSDTLFVEINPQLGARGDGYGDAIKNGGVTSPVFNDKTDNGKSSTGEKHTTVLSETDPDNKTSLNTDNSKIDKRSLYDKKLVKGVGGDKDGGIKGDKDKHTIGTPDGTDDNGGVFLKGRKALDLPAPGNRTNVYGKIVVRIWVDRKGNVVKAIEGEGSTVTNADLIKMTLNAALKSRFNADPDAKEVQEGKITYTIKYLSK